MYMEILDILICPKCQARLKLESKKHIASEVIEGTLLCTGNHQWKIEGGVINFESEEQENANNWNELYKKMDYEELFNNCTKNNVELIYQKWNIIKFNKNIIDYSGLC